MTLGNDLFLLAGIIEGFVMLGVLVVVGKAAIAYRQHDSRPMLLLAVGLFLLLIAPPGFEIAAEAVIEGSTESAASDSPTIGTLGTLMLVEQLIRLSGIAALLSSLYVRE